MHQNIITNPVQLRLETFGFMEQSRCTEEKQNFCINLRKFVCRQIPPELIKRADRRPASLKAKSSRLRWWMEIKAVPTVLLQEHSLSPNRPSILCDVDTWALRLLVCLLQTPRHLYLITRFHWPPDSANTLTSTCKHTPSPNKWSLWTQVRTLWRHFHFRTHAQIRPNTETAGRAVPWRILHCREMISGVNIVADLSSASSKSTLLSLFPCAENHLCPFLVMVAPPLSFIKTIMESEGACWHKWLVIYCFDSQKSRFIFCQWKYHEIKSESCCAKISGWV